VVIRVTDLRNGQEDYAVLDDRMLVLDFQAGHPEAFVEIHRRYSALARHVCQRFLPNAHDADEALQETMIRVFQGLYKFNGRYALQPWIGRIATNVSLDAIRTRARRPQVHDDAVDEFERQDHAEGPEEAVERLVDRDLVLSVLAGLPESHRTALVLRELEGRSHKEIAETMGMSTGQAKALIHRAKGSFRRRWLQKAAERGGLSGIAVLPLLWAANLAGVVRRLADKAGHAAQAAQAAAPEIVSSAAGSTVASAASGGFGERVLAAGMTLLVAGGVTVGAATIVKNRGDHDTGRVVAAAAPAPVIEEERTPAVAEPPRDRPRDDRPPMGESDDVHVDPVVVEPSPTVEPTEAPPDPTTEPEPTPEPEPSPEPSPEPPPPPPEPPAYEFSVDSAVPFSSLCPCFLAASVSSSTFTPGEGGSLYARETLQVTGIANSKRAFDLHIEYEAAVAHGSGTLTTTFYLETPDGGWYSYEGSASLVSATATEHGADYVFSGSYGRTNGDVATDEIPSSGPLNVVLKTWGGETLYRSSFALGD
jgi:RNA polymerase sigma-70 factor (ECF subfamily)